MTAAVVDPVGQKANCSLIVLMFFILPFIFGVFSVLSVYLFDVLTEQCMTLWFGYGFMLCD